jgi:hypothetical protein
VISRRLSAFLDALAAGRRPRRFKARPDDVPLVRTAIDLRAARPGEAQPDGQFVSDLYQKLHDQMSAAGTSGGAFEARRVRGRGKLALAAVAASAALIAGTVAVTESMNQGPTPTTASQVPRGDVLRTGTFVTADNQVLGQIVAYRGNPSWVFMKVTVPHYDGPITCELQTADGSVATWGTFRVRDGIGQFSRTIGVEVGALRGARLVTSTGSPVASATFA